MAILAGNEAKATIMILVIGIFLGLIAGQLAWDRSEKHPDYVMPVGDRVIVVIMNTENPHTFTLTRKIILNLRQNLDQTPHIIQCPKKR